MNRRHLPVRTAQFRACASPVLRPRWRWGLAASIGFVLLWSCNMAFGQAGNRDYYNPGTGTDEKAIFENVHSYHLQPAYDALKRGNWKSAHDNFEFILNGFPNSPQALNGMSELCVNKWKSPQCDADSWFDKAIARNPTIATTWVIYGIHLERKKLPREAVEKFEHALELNPDDINAHYNLGLAYFDLKEYDKANQQAQRSYALGAPLPGLRDKLMRAGAWKPAAASQSDAADTSAATNTITPPHVK